MDFIPSRAMDIFALRRAVDGAEPLRGWKSCKIYEALARDGAVTELPGKTPFHRRFEITDIGREFLSDCVERDLTKMEASNG
jgi:hypothetical protein